MKMGPRDEINKCANRISHWSLIQGGHWSEMAEERQKDLQKPCTKPEGPGLRFRRINVYWYGPYIHSCIKIFFFIRNPSLHKFLSIFYQIFIHFLSNSLHSRFPSPHSTKTTRQGQGWLPQYQTQWVTLLLTGDADHSQSLQLPSLWHLHWHPRFSSSPRYRALLSKALGSYPLSPDFLGCFSSLSTTTLLVDLILSRGLKGHLYADGICTYPHTLDLLSETCISHCLLSISTRVSDRLTCPEPNFWPAPPNPLH